MNVLAFLLPLALALGGFGLAMFLWSLKTRQFDDCSGAACRILLDDDTEEAPVGVARGFEMSGGMAPEPPALAMTAGMP